MKTLTRTRPLFATLAAALLVGVPAAQAAEPQLAMTVTQVTVDRAGTARVYFSVSCDVPTWYGWSVAVDQFGKKGKLTSGESGNWYLNYCDPAALPAYPYEAVREGVLYIPVHSAAGPFQAGWLSVQSRVDGEACVDADGNTYGQMECLALTGTGTLTAVEDLNPWQPFRAAREK
jgi:hypothetical protein